MLFALRAHAARTNQSFDDDEAHTTCIYMQLALVVGRRNIFRRRQLRVISDSNDLRSFMLPQMICPALVAISGTSGALA
jgi:hypothetical protein